MTLTYGSENIFIKLNKKKIENTYKDRTYKNVYKNIYSLLEQNLHIHFVTKN